MFPSFNSFSNAFFPGFRLINIFSSWFSFYLSNWSNKESNAMHICKLDKCILHALTDSKTVVIVSNMSIKN